MDFFKSRRDLSKYMNRPKSKFWPRVRFVLAVLCLILAFVITIVINT